MSTNNISKITYNSADHPYVEYEYDALDRVTSKSYNGTVKAEYKYDKLGRLYSKNDIMSGVEYSYLYDLSGRTLGIKLNSTWATIEYPLIQAKEIIYGIVSNDGAIHILS